MTASIEPGVTAKNAVDATSTVAPVKPESVVLARVDFAHIANDKLFVYGWVLGLGKSVHSASIHLGSIAVDLLKQAVKVRRPDIAQHLSLDAGDDQHGFYALVDLPEPFDLVDHLRLSVVLSSGERAESYWPVPDQVILSASMKEPYLATCNDLLLRLPRPEAKRLVEFATALGLSVGSELLNTLPPPIKFSIDLCCLLEGRILLVSGWLFDPAKELTLAQLRVGGSVFNLLESSVRVPRAEVDADTALYGKGKDPQNPGFIFVRVIQPADTAAQEAKLVFSAGTETLRTTRAITGNPADARRELLALLKKMDPDSALSLIECLTAALDNSPEQRSLRALLALVYRGATDRLPVSIQHSNPRYHLHIDQVIPVADKGIFLLGWFNSEPGLSLRILCHCGSSSFAVSDNWMRQYRPDVSSYLATLGIQSGENKHGFTCYVPLKNGDAPYYVSATLQSGGVKRMSVTVPEKNTTPIQTVRALLTFFHNDHPDLRQLMETQVGPLVRTVWAAGTKPARDPVFRSYGAPPADPRVSIIVPLYGRHDFAEYQMALFADDPDFQSVELIYVVDDPSIYADFSRVCSDLYELYRVPFRTAFSGLNLGFAAANNFGAGIARAPYLILLNSDVMPRQRGWASELLRTYLSLSNPGVLGAKLLYEDGSIQHAGIAFRRHSPWGDMWINDHPFKGQSPLGLTGVREADAVTAACAVIETSLYRQLGGFSEDYIIGDFEDSDLCLRANSVGRKSYVALDIELYHLERQSQNQTGDLNWRANLTLYNCWLHNSRWANFIETTRPRKSSPPRDRE